MSLDLNSTADVQGLIAQLGGQKITMIVIDTFSENTGGSTALFAAADNVIDVRDGEAKFLKRKESPVDADDEYFVWSNEHRAWWRQGARGYSRGLREAGRYTREQAMRICRDAIFTSMHVGMVAEIPVRVGDVSDFLKGQLVPSALVNGEG